VSESASGLKSRIWLKSYVSNDLHRRASDAAEECGLSLSAWIRQMVLRALNDK
jgi:predicted HicB family RNase H-like nuclease